MKTRTILIITAVLAGGLMLCGFTWAAENAAPTVAAKFCNTPFGRLVTGQIGRLLVLKSQLNVTDEQREKIRATVAPHRAEITSAVKDIVVKKRALQGKVRADKTDEQSIRAAAGELGKSIGDAAVLAAKVRAEVVPILTDEQKKVIEQFRGDSQGAVDKWLGEIGQAEPMAQ